VVFAKESVTLTVAHSECEHVKKKCLVKVLKILSKLGIFKLKSKSVIMALYQPAKKIYAGRSTTNNSKANNL